MDLYSILGVPRDASPEAIKATYKRLAARIHPDRPGGDAERMAAVNDAYRVLSDPAARKRYDETGKTSAGPTPESKGQDLVIEVLSHFIADPECSNLITRSRQALCDLDLKMRSERSKVQESIKVLEKRRKKIKYKGTGTDLVLSLLESRLQDVTRRRDEIDLIVAACKIGLSLLDQYESSEEEGPLTYESLMQMAQAGLNQRSTGFAWGGKTGR